MAARIIASNTVAKEQNLFARPLPAAPTPHSTPVVTTEKTATAAPSHTAGMFVWTSLNQCPRCFIIASMAFEMLNSSLYDETATI